MAKIDLTITIPTFNEERDIGDCLKSIVMQDYPKNKFEVIIVDNHSEDKTLEIVRSFSKKINLRIISNDIKDAEVSKMIGFENARGEYFMYLDADMRFSTKDFIRKMLLPFDKDERIVGNFVQFVLNEKHPALTRCLSYDEFQRDPIFKFFTIGIKDVVKEKNPDYWLCECNINKIPPQSLMIYKRSLILDYGKENKQLIDNEIPAVLVDLGYRYFAYVPSVGVEHLLLRSLKELWHKRVRNLQRTYFPNVSKRKFKWINWKTQWPKVILWMIYTNTFVLGIINAVYKTIKYQDTCFLSEPALNIVSTYSIIYGVLQNKYG